MLRVFPFLSLPVLAYFIILGSDPGGLYSEVLSLELVSGARFSMNTNEGLILFGLCILFLEILKATYAGLGSLWDHALSLVLFVVCLIAFLTLPMAATPTFLFLTCIAFIDVITGYSIAVRAARRDISIS